jgi:hypothetical protein
MSTCASCPLTSYGAALNYFTGSKDHNVALRKIAVAKGWTLNEYGLFKKPSAKNSDGKDGGGGASLGGNGGSSGKDSKLPKGRDIG